MVSLESMQALVQSARERTRLFTLTEATRRGARMAVVCPLNVDVAKKVAVFDTVNGSLASSPVVHGLTTDAIDVKYHNEFGADEANPINVKFVEVSIISGAGGYQFQFVVPGLNQIIDVPSFRTTLYAESLGAVPTYPGDPTQAPRCDF